MAASSSSVAARAVFTGASTAVVCERALARERRGFFEDDWDIDRTGAEGDEAGLCARRGHIVNAREEQFSCPCGSAVDR